MEILSNEGQNESIYSQSPRESETEEEENDTQKYHFLVPQETFMSDCGDDFDRSARQDQDVRCMKSKIRRERSIALHSGQSYITSNGNIRRQRQCQKLNDCRMKCAQKLTPETCQAIHEELLKLGSSHAKRLYLAPLISVAPKKTERKSEFAPSQQRNRMETRRYHVCVEGENIPVCKGCFVRIFDLSNRAIDTIVRKKSGNPFGILEEDQRGRHSPPQKLTKEKIELIQQHILSCLAYTSDYSREKTSENYLPSHLTLKKMYDLYIEKYPHEKISRWSYERQFHSIVGIQNYLTL